MKASTWLKFATVAAGGYAVSKMLAPPDYSFRGKVAIVTGGSRGLGLEIARRLGADGAQVAICARDPDDLADAVEDLDRRGIEVFAGPCDVADRAQVEGFVNAVNGRFGRVDVLVNNAGLIGVGPLENMSDDDFNDSIDTHFHGPRHFCEAVLPQMRARRSGRIVNVASIGGKMNLPHALPYCAGKFALVGYSEGLGVEVAKHGVRVTTVCPGMVRTGSPLNVEYKGQAEKEMAWFATADVLPLASIDSGEAAERILDACRKGRRAIVFPATAKAAVLFHGVFHDFSLGATEWLDRLMPKPGPSAATGRLGRHAERRVPTIVRERTHAIAESNNEI